MTPTTTSRTVFSRSARSRRATDFPGSGVSGDEAKPPSWMRLSIRQEKLSTFLVTRRASGGTSEVKGFHLSP